MSLQSKEMIFFEVSLYLIFLSMNQKCWFFLMRQAVTEETPSDDMATAYEENH